MQERQRHQDRQLGTFKDGDELMPECDCPRYLGTPGSTSIDSHGTTDNFPSFRDLSLFAVVLFPLNLALAHDAWAQNAVDLEIIPTGQGDSAHPRLVILPAVDATELRLRVECDGTLVENAGPASAGERIEMEIPVPTGTWQCKGSLAGQFVDGSTGEMPLSFQVQQFAPLTITVPRETLDLAGRHLEVTTDRPCSQIEVSVFVAAGEQLGAGLSSNMEQNPDIPVLVEWKANEGEVFRIHVKVVESNGLWRALDLFPWCYKVPHEDVIFETGQAEILMAEERKLVSALRDAESELARYPHLDIPMNLYVAGYTDTVGDPATNLALSLKRAEAIARWFKDRGFGRPIYFQGFGESALAVQTADQVDEPRNRRALYILAAEEPPRTEEIPDSRWRRLQ